ncbi:hypothetical protein WJX81_002365 [Elliptochloris bilobata]|uniref:Uncharacterized protein n=1 Tax=Elliptochloris bilobata TaxID=381761 RepID=A0AAW1R1A9_9CHLO
MKSAGADPQLAQRAFELAQEVIYSAGAVVRALALALAAQLDGAAEQPMRDAVCCTLGGLCVDGGRVALAEGERADGARTAVLAALEDQGALTHDGWRQLAEQPKPGPTAKQGSPSWELGSMRALRWLFKANKPDGWVAFASLVGSLARSNSTFPALLHIVQIPSASAAVARDDEHLRMLSRLLGEEGAAARHAGAAAVHAVLEADASTHWCLGEAGALEALVLLLSDRQRNREAFVIACGPAVLRELLADVPDAQRPADEAAGALDAQESEAQYCAARIVRQLALDGSDVHKEIATTFLPALVHAMKVGRARVAFASAVAVSTAVEGRPAAAETVACDDGIAPILHMLSSGGGLGKKAAAECLQALAAEHAGLRMPIVFCGALPPLVQLARTGNLQQQAAAVGALGALLAYSPGSESGIAEDVACVPGAVDTAVALLSGTPLPLRITAAVMLCNLSQAPAGPQVPQEACIGLVQLLAAAQQAAQADGQYAAAAALCNLAREAPVCKEALSAGAVLPIVSMLTAESWYCRIVAAHLLARLLVHSECSAECAMDAVPALLALIQLQHSEGMLELADEPVAHLAYERGAGEIVLRGYKFASAKLAAAAALGCLARCPQAAVQIAEDGADELAGLLISSLEAAQALGAAVLADVASALPGSWPFLRTISSKARGLVEAARMTAQRGGATAVLVRAGMCRFAITAKPSAHHRMLLQLPFGDLRRSASGAGDHGVLSTPRLMNLNTWRAARAAPAHASDIPSAA